jgi:hypothetical protein
MSWVQARREACGKSSWIGEGLGCLNWTEKTKGFSDC